MREKMRTRSLKGTHVYKESWVGKGLHDTGGGILRTALPRECKDMFDPQGILAVTAQHPTGTTIACCGNTTNTNNSLFLLLC